MGSDKPIIESLCPNPVNQNEALENQFKGMTDISFNYDNYETARTELIKLVNENLSDKDKDFLLSFELGEPDWSKCCAGNLSQYPSVKWKLQNIIKLKTTNPHKFQEGIKKLKSYLFNNHL